MDACIPLTSTFSAITCGLKDGGEMIVDPDLQQEEACHSLLTFAVDNNSEEFLMSHANGGFTIEQVCMIYVVKGQQVTKLYLVYHTHTH